MQLLFGTRTSGDINLVAQILMIVGLWVGFYFARTKQIPKHSNVQTTVVLANLFFIAFIMVPSFYSFVILGGSTSGSIAILMMVHGLLGLIAELTGIYLILRMRTQLIPPRFRVRNFRLLMRSLLGLWTLIIILGFGIYYLRYLPPNASAADTALAHLRQGADDITIHADEMQAAAQRGNLATAKRHAEHLINLIDGKTGADYGDPDGDGFVEDPGDGVGVTNYLAQVRANSGNGPAAQVADHLRAEMIQVVADAKGVIQGATVNAVIAPASESTRLADQMNTGGADSVPQLVQLLGGNATLPVVTAQYVPSGPNSVTVNMKNFEYSPKTLTVKKGTTVVFVNQDNAKHTVKDDKGEFNSKDILAGQTFVFTFSNAGSFAYHCEFHGDKGGVGMAGIITVQ